MADGQRSCKPYSGSSEDGIPAEDIDEALVSSYMYTAGQPDPDLIIRTSGELRTSGFMMWQSAYSEYYITPTFWPDFGREELYEALVAYGERDRRYGGIKVKGEAEN